MASRRTPCFHSSFASSAPDQPATLSRTSVPTTTLGTFTDAQGLPCSTLPAPLSARASLPGLTPTSANTSVGAATPQPATPVWTTIAIRRPPLIDPYTVSSDSPHTSNGTRVALGPAGYA